MSRWKRLKTTCLFSSEGWQAKAILTHYLEIGEIIVYAGKLSDLAVMSRLAATDAWWVVLSEKGPNQFDDPDIMDSENTLMSDMVMLPRYQRPTSPTWKRETMATARGMLRMLQEKKQTLLERLAKDKARLAQALELAR